MNFKMKALLLMIVFLMGMAIISGCAQQETPYQINDQQNYNVSVKYDANGGLFADNTSIVVDSYNISEIQKNGNGEVEIALLSPDDSRRGVDAFQATKNGYFLAGWYSERTEITDDTGDTSYTYSGKWDFETERLKLEADGSYSAEEPQLTLYAVWVPLLEVNFYNRADGELLSTMVLDPTISCDILTPQWNTETGAIQMNSFPELKGYTFNGAYFDEQANEPITSSVITHPGKVDYSTGTVKDSTLNLYIDWKEGEWFRIFTAEQFVDNASINGNYIIEADLDFSEETWPTKLMHGNFAGTIQGNGYIFKNVKASQTDNSKVNSGLFGNLTEKAVISDLTFENATFTIERGTRVRGASFGLFAGTISDAAQLTNVKIMDSVLQIDSGAYFGSDDYMIGLICGMGPAEKIETGNILCIAVGDTPETVTITISDQVVTLENVG